MKKVQISTNLILVFILGACGQRHKTTNVEFRNLNQRQIGYIVQIEPGQESLLENNFSGSINAIDISRGLYEILPPFTIANIERVLPQSEVSKNVVIRPDLPAEKEKAYAQMLDRPGSQFRPCVDDPEPPKPEISVLNESELEGKGDSLNRGQVLRLSAQSSESHPNHPGSLAFEWKVLFPNEQEPQGPFSVESNFDVQLNDLGVYQIGLVAQDPRGVCAKYVIQVGVTDNPKMVPNVSQTLLPLSKLDGDFGHLQIMNAERAWTLSRGKGQKIAVIDSGVNYNHPYLSANIAINEKEIPDNNIDDDHNGRIDDVFGWDFVQDDALPFDDAGHGSHVAGLAAGKVFGMAQEAKIIPIKGLSYDGSGNLALIIGSIYYAVDSGATVINLSLGFPESANAQIEAPLRKAFAYAESKNVVIVTAAGNGEEATNGSTIQVNIDARLNLPAGLDFLNNIAVAATNALGELTSYSNFGVRSVKVAAPGGDGDKPVFSAKQDNSIGKLFVGSSGTSMATPLVSGSIAMALAANPKMSMKDLNQMLLVSGKIAPALQGKVKSQRVLDAFTLVSNAQSLKTTPPKIVKKKEKNP